VAYPALGLSYYRVQLSDIRATSPIGAGADDREDQSGTKVRLRSLTLNEFGATVGQSLGNHLVVASTVKLVHGHVATDVRPREAASLDAAAELDGESEMHSALDFGVLGHVGVLRGALTVRNVNEPTFGERDATVQLAREVRAGVSVVSARGFAMGAADLDLTTRSTPFGDERRLALGAELWTATRVIGVRGGFSRSTIGEPRRAGSGGISVMVRRGTYLDVAATGGSDFGRRGWGAALRMTF
jgi:F plasmid transfer operon, TraF, protein